jgi:orotidine-5'-phosphate decarboxylase
MSISLKDRLIVPLDVPTADDADTIIRTLGDDVSFYKIGYQLMPVGGIDLAQSLSAAGKKVFLDFKFLDIGATVEKGVASAARLGGDFITVHADPDSLKGAVQGRGDDPRLKILAVTVLTSWDADTLKAYFIDKPVEELVLHRAEMALTAGVDGVVASAQEASAIRQRFGDELTIVTPGVRPKGASMDDQKRVVTPGDALKAGSDHLVIGRPILKAPVPKEAIAAIHNEMAAALTA